jgi:hypothetical protein
MGVFRNENAAALLFRDTQQQGNALGGAAEASSRRRGSMGFSSGIFYHGWVEKRISSLRYEMTNKQRVLRYVTLASKAG